MDSSDKTLIGVLKNNFGYSSFRSDQKEIIQRVLAGGDSVVLMPTGGGKSLCYQLPSLLLPGLTLVVSPLIALMKDQVNALQANGIEAAFYNSSLGETEAAEVLDRIHSGKLKLLYVSPERVLSAGFLATLSEIDLSLIAIDEAHCVSSWGHSFRPEYRRLKTLASRFPDLPIIALTATADRAVRSEIAELLGLRDPEIFISSFNRPNIRLSVLPGREKFRQIESILKQHPGESGIIYCSSRKACENLADKLEGRGHAASAYHAGMSAQAREKVHDDFLTDKVRIICATIAFGMGIDKPDIRFVIHYNMPGNLESYYQEIGRGGRDGAPASAYLFYSYRDVQTQQRFLEEVTNEEYRRIQELKIGRMQEYAEAPICRRKVLLSYFSEALPDDCGNCDVCSNPPEYFNGTIPAQKALSAVARSRQNLPVSAIIDLLRGVHSKELQERELTEIKTFGVGKDISQFAWQLYIQQLVQQGLLEIDYRNHFRLILTELSKAVLFENHPVELISFETIKRRQEDIRNLQIHDEPPGDMDPGLYEELKELRRTIAAEIGKPAFVIFSDASLRDMAARKPSSQRELLEVKGVGAFKAEHYGEAFLQVIRGN